MKVRAYFSSERMNEPSACLWKHVVNDKGKGQWRGPGVTHLAFSFYWMLMVTKVRLLHEVSVYFRNIILLTDKFTKQEGKQRANACRIFRTSWQIRMKWSWTSQQLSASLFCPDNLNHSGHAVPCTHASPLTVLLYYKPSHVWVLLLTFHCPFHMGRTIIDSWGSLYQGVHL